MVRIRSSFLLGGLVVLLTLGLASPAAFAQCMPGEIEVQTGVCIIDGAAVEKYKIPLVIPPVMNYNTTNPDPARIGPDIYDIAVRQFRQQILPGGIWTALGATTQNYPPTKVWSYGPAVDPEPDASLIPGLGALPPGVAPAANSQFNYPAYTLETQSNVPVSVRWINDLKENFGAGPNFLPHLLPIDQTLHWANPAQIQCMDGGNHTDCRPVGDGTPAGNAALQLPYTGPVPIVTHVHGAHVDPHSDGYPEAWWLPAAGNIPAGFATSGTFFDDSTGANPGNLGYADYVYRQDQPATTLWYHDHSLGMTRSNVYAGPAGFWLVRGGLYDRPRVTGSNRMAKLPSPGPSAGQTVLELNLPTNIRKRIREIPIVIQDRSFKPNGDLFYPDNRDFFEGLDSGDLAGFGVQFSPDSDVAPIWNPEAFFNIMVVNGVAWPELEVAPALYRLRFLNGCNSRFLWLKFSDPDVKVYQIGAEQGFLPSPVYMNALNLDGGADDGTAQILMALAERADVIVDFRGLVNNTMVELLNIGPDEPFGGGIPGDFTPADPDTTGKVMRFRVNTALTVPQDSRTTPPDQLDLMAEPALGVADNAGSPRKVSLNEEESATQTVCINGDEEIVGGPPCGMGEEEVPFGPTAALLGTVTGSGDTATGNALTWTDTTGASTPTPVTMADGITVKMVNVTENPLLNTIEEWDIYNFTVDAHPIHLHLVRFAVVNRTINSADSPNYVEIPGDPPTDNIGDTRGPEGWEMGFKDTVIAYPGEITKVKALFDIAGLYVWHCHIVEHEDNEMMRPYVVSP